MDTEKRRGTGGTSAGINPFETLYMKMRRRLFVATTCVLGLAKGTDGTAAGINPSETLYMKMRHRFFVSTAGIDGEANYGGGKREDYLSWEEYFMAIAFLSAQRSKDPRTQVRACIVNKENRIVGTGYNGMPNGCCDCKLSWKHGNKQMYVCHAEMNAVLNKYAADVRDSRMYVSLFPCNECTKIIIQAGLAEVIYYSDKKADKPETKASKEMLKLAGVRVRQYRPERDTILIDFKSIEAPETKQ